MKASLVKLLAATCLCLGVAGAEVHTLTLRQAMDRALEQNPDVLLSRLDERKSREQVSITRDPFSLKLGVGSGAAYTYGFPASINGNAPSIFRAQGNMTLFDRPQSYRVAAASEAVRGAALDVTLQQQEAVYQVYAAFLDAELAVRDADAIRQQALNLTQVRQYHEARAAEGRERELPAKQASLEIRKAEQAGRNFAAVQRTAEQTLAQLLGYPAGDQVRPAAEERGQIPAPATEEISTVQAIESSSEIRRLESNIRAKMLEVKSFQAERLPKINMISDYSLLARFNNFDKFYPRFQRNNVQVGASIEVPILVGRAPAAAASQAQADIDKMRIEIQRARGRITAQIRQAYEDLEIAEGARQIAGEDRELAHDQTLQDLAAFEEGRAPMAQVEASRAVEQQKWVAYYGAQRDVEAARLNVLRATGTLLAAVR